MSKLVALLIVAVCAFSLGWILHRPSHDTWFCVHHPGPQITCRRQP